MSQGKQDQRPPRNGWAPGTYTCICACCKERFMGDKRAVQCADCAYDETQVKQPTIPSQGDINRGEQKVQAALSALYALNAMDLDFCEAGSLAQLIYKCQDTLAPAQLKLWSRTVQALTSQPPEPVSEDDA